MSCRNSIKGPLTLTYNILLSRPPRVAGETAICSAAVLFFVYLFISLGPDFLDNGSRPSLNGLPGNNWFLELKMLFGLHIFVLDFTFWLDSTVNIGPALHYAQGCSPYLSNFSREVRVVGFSGHNDIMLQETMSNRQDGSSMELKLTPHCCFYTLHRAVNHFS